MDEQIKFIIGSMRDLCKSAFEKTNGDIDLYIRLDEISDNLADVTFYLENKKCDVP